MRKSITLILELLLVSVVFFGCGKNDSAYSEKIMRYVDEAGNEFSPITIDMADFTSFSWDKMLIFEPMASKTEIEKELGFTVDAKIDVFSGVIFFNQEKTVYFSEFKESFDGNYGFKIVLHRENQSTQKYEIVSRESAKFYCTKSKNSNGGASYLLSLVTNN